MRLTPAGYLWLGYVAAFGVAGVAVTCSGDAKGAERTEAYRLAFRAVMCPPDWRATISQRYDDRDRWGWIVKRTWITRCV